MPEIAVLSLEIIDGVTSGLPLDGEIESFTVGFQDIGKFGRGSGSLADFKSFTVVREPDEFSNRLLVMLATNENLDSVSIVQDSFAQGQFITRTLFSFTDALVTAISRFGSGSAVRDRVSFSFQSFSILN